MIKLQLQMFGGRGGSAGGSSGSFSIKDMPSTLDDDVYRMYEIRILEGSKQRTEDIFATRWQIAEKEMNFAENHNMTYSQYLRQTRYSYMPVQYYNASESSKSANELFTEKGARKEYRQSKKEFWERYKKYIGKK